jgi:5-methylcytosine-specific restriction endonuclease McrA
MKRNYDDPVYKRWRISVYKRDNFTCQMPGCKKKTTLQAHHIQKWANASMLRYDIDNGITLCKKCHKEVTGNEHHYQSLFRDILRKKNG